MKKRERSIVIGDFNKHIFGTGLPGFGKTTLVLNLIIQLLAKDYSVLVIEGTKSEYRALKTLRTHEDPELRELAKSTRIFSPGREDISPFRDNPLIVPAYSTTEQRIQHVFRALKASLAMEGALTHLILESLYVLYERHGSRKVPPTMDDLLRIAEEVVRSKGYDSETESCLLGALRTRLGALCLGDVGCVFRTLSNEPDIPSFFEPGLTILELNALAQEPAALLSLNLLADLAAYASSLPYQGDKPKLIVIIDEAHVLAGRRGPAVASESAPDTSAFVSEFIETLLAECRAIGISLVIFDQRPSAITPTVLKSTSSTISFRLRDAEDRDAIADIMLLDAQEREDLARLPVGEAFLMTPGFYWPRRVRVPNIKQKLNLADPPIGDAILPLIKDEPWFIEATRRRHESQYAILLDRLTQRELKLDDYTEECEVFIQNAVARLRGSKQDDPRQLIHTARRRRDALLADHTAYENRIYKSLLGVLPPCGLDNELTDIRSHIETRYTQAIQNRTNRLIAQYDALLDPANKKHSETF